MQMSFKMRSLVILGPTASGKTKLGVQVAFKIDGEIISADSRQVYRKMDIGTGKDLSEYQVAGQSIPYHLIDIRNAGEKYTLNDYQKDFRTAYQLILSKEKTPVIVGGTGLYIEAILKNYTYSHVPNIPALRKSLESKSKDELLKILIKKNMTGIKFDTSTTKRLIRAIEISEFIQKNEMTGKSEPLDAVIFGIKLPRNEILKRIKTRLKERLEGGMIEEVKNLLDQGIQPDDLIYYGLEYKFVTLFLKGKLKYNEMHEKLNVAIRQFAKRQMTWFRRMGRNGFKINWIDGLKPVEEQLQFVLGHPDQQSDKKN